MECDLRTLNTQKTLPLKYSSDTAGGRAHEHTNKHHHMHISPNASIFHVIRMHVIHHSYHSLSIRVAVGTMSFCFQCCCLSIHYMNGCYNIVCARWLRNFRKTNYIWGGWTVKIRNEEGTRLCPENAGKNQSRHFNATQTVFSEPIQIRFCEYPQRTELIFDNRASAACGSCICTPDKQAAIHAHCIE